MFIINTAIIFIIYYISPQYFSYITYLYTETLGISITTIFMPFYFIINSIITSAFDNDIGKKIIGIKIQKNNQNRLQIKDIIERNIIIYITGYFIGIPILSTVAKIIEYYIYKKEETTSWDKRIKTSVIQNGSNTLRTIISITVCLIVQYNCLKFIEKNNKINIEAQKEIKEKINIAINNKEYNRYDNAFVSVFGKDGLEEMIKDTDKETNKGIPYKINNNITITKIIKGEDTIYYFYKIIQKLNESDYNTIYQEYCKNIETKYNGKGIEIILYIDGITETETIMHNPTECIQ